MFEANCSRQKGQHKKKIFHQMLFFGLYTGVTKVRVSDGDRNKRRRKQEEDRQEGADVKNIFLNATVHVFAEAEKVLILSHVYRL